MDHLTLSFTLIVLGCGIYIAEWLTMKKQRRQREEGYQQMLNAYPEPAGNPADISTVPILFLGGPMDGVRATCPAQQIFKHSRPRITFPTASLVEYECGPLRGNEQSLIMTFRHPKLEKQLYVTWPVPEPN